MRHLVIGVSGQVGGHLQHQLKDEGYEVLGTYWHHAVADQVALDFTDADSVRQILESYRPAVVWVPAALPDVDRCEREPEVSRLLNVHAPGQLAELSRDIGAKLVFFSTDYVYDGTAGPYKESDAPNPLQVYGMHKLETETFLLKNIPHALIIRSAWIYSQDPNPRNFVFRIVQQLEAGQVVKAAIDQINTPTDSDDLARRAIRAVRRNAEGILHIVGTERLSRYELTRKIADQHGFSDALIEPITTASLKLPARRPLNGGLVTQYTLGV